MSTSYFGQLADPLVEVMLPLIVWLAAKMLYMPMGEAQYYVLRRVLRRGFGSACP